MQAIIFDLFETLITEFDAGWQPERAAAAPLGLDEERFTAGWKALQHQRMAGIIPDYPAILRAICKQAGCVANESMIQRLQQERIADKARAFAAIERPVVQMLKQLRRLPVKIGLLSNAAREETLSWSSSILPAYFDDVIFSFEVGLVKPQREIYELACARLGATPAETLFVGDGGSDELIGAAHAGLIPLWATWFLDRWPQRKRSAAKRAEAAQFPRLYMPGELQKYI